jgi:hypothetical protein
MKSRWTLERRKEQSNRMSGKNNPMFGKEITEQHRKNLILSHLGHKLSEETKRKIGLVHLGKKESKKTCKNISKGRKGIIFSEEHKKKISNSLIGKCQKEKHWNWKKGIAKSNGYVYIKTENGYKKRCIILIEQKIGRELIKNEVVHHINGIKDDDRIENLQLLTKGQHSSVHMKGNNYARGK